jgi:hypothetical protein
MDMKPLISKWLTVGIILLFVGVTIGTSINFNTVKASPEDNLIYGKQVENNLVSFFNPIKTYPTCISIDIDTESVNHTFTRDVAHLIKGTVGYKICVPDWLLHSHFNIFRLIKTWYLFGTNIVYPMKIHLTVDNVPSWADICFLTPDIYIQDYDNEFSYASFDFVVTPYIQAPSGPYTIYVQAETSPVHRLESSMNSLAITFIVE